MPIQSKNQQAAMYAAKAGNSTLGIPQNVGADFVAAGPAGGSFAKLPQKKAKKKPSDKRRELYEKGQISDKAMEKAGY
jgi:hypothetical protein